MAAVFRAGEKNVPLHHHRPPVVMCTDRCRCKQCKPAAELLESLRDLPSNQNSLLLQLICMLNAVVKL